MSKSNVIYISGKRLKNMILEAIDLNKQDVKISRRAEEFFKGKHGKAILALMNGERFNRDKVEEYLEGLGSSDIKWARLMDVIANHLGINHKAFSTYQKLIKEMLTRIEVLYIEYVSSLK